MIRKTILIPHIKVQNANALSSPFTIGFPAMTAWLGAMHALERKLKQPALAIQFEGIGIISHNFDLQTYKGPGDYEYSIVGTANPLDKNGDRSSFIEEARCHLEVSLVVEFSGADSVDDETLLLQRIESLLDGQIKIAGGDILTFQKPRIHREFLSLRSKLMPGYALIERRDLMQAAMKNGMDAMDAILDYVTIHHRCEQTLSEESLKVEWISEKRASGEHGEKSWLVPIATGFHGISELKQALNQRDSSTPHRFAEAVVTLGEFKMAYKCQSLDELIWRYHYDAEENLYLCQQNNPHQVNSFLDDGF